MTREELLHIINRYLHGKATAEEEEAINRFLDNRQKNTPRYQQEELPQKKLQIKTAVYQQVLNEIERIEAQQQNHKKPLKKWRWYAAAMLTIALCIGGVLTFQNKKPTIHYITKATARGQKLTVKLPDGSLVKLNAESSVTFPESFGALNTRSVQLSGEAFFEVVKNPEKPFQATAGQALVTVLGTSFNVNAYPEDTLAQVSVATGKVALAPASINGNGGHLSAVSILTPGERGTYYKQSARIVKSSVDIDATTAWTRKTIHFNQVPLRRAMKTLARWYGVDITLTGHIDGVCLIDGNYQNESLANVLESLKFLGRLEYEFVTNQQIKISGNPCIN